MDVDQYLDIVDHIKRADFSLGEPYMEGQVLRGRLDLDDGTVINPDIMVDVPPVDLSDIRLVLISHYAEMYQCHVQDSALKAVAEQFLRDVLSISANVTIR